MGVHRKIYFSNSFSFSFFFHANLRTATIDCLTEIASLPPHDIPSQYHPAMQALLVHLVQSLLEIIPPSADLRRAFENGSDEDCLFVKRLALLLGEWMCCFSFLFLF